MNHFVLNGSCSPFFPELSLKDVQQADSFLPLPLSFGVFPAIFFSKGKRARVTADFYCRKMSGLRRTTGENFITCGPELFPKKNLWRRKCVRRTIFRNVEVRVEGGFAPFNPYFVCNKSNCVTVRPVRGHLTPKMNIPFFIRNLMLNIFLSDNSFEKSYTFRKNRKKLFWGRI